MLRVTLEPPEAADLALYTYTAKPARERECLQASCTRCISQVAVTYVPAPSFILALQLLSCAVFVRTLSAAGAVEAEPLTLAKARPFAVIVFGFIGTLYSNITSLKARAWLRAPSASFSMRLIKGGQYVC